MTNKLVVIVGPTASGKSALAVQFAKKFNGEIISADSRQVYKGLDIGSGKITTREMMGIPHHLLGVASPKRRFTVAQYRYRAIQAIASIVRQEKFPLLVGGSPFYIYSVVDGWAIPEVKPDIKLRKKLEKLSVEQLFLKLKELDPQRAKTIESKNRRRLIRALEIVLTTKKPVPKLKKTPLPYQILFLGIKKSPQELKNRIQERFLKMLKRGLLKEVQTLRKSGLSWKRIEGLGLEYREAVWYLQNKISRTEMIRRAVKSTIDFSRRQMSWFKKDSRIHWARSPKEAQRLLRQFILARSKVSMHHQKIAMAIN